MPAQDGYKISLIAGRTDAAGAAAPDWDQEECRMINMAMLTPGILPNLLTQAANPLAWRVRQDTGANMQIKVGNGATAKIDGLVLRGTVAGQGSYIMRSEAASKTITVPAADAVNPSRFAVFAFCNDTAYSGTASRAFADVSCIRGTPAGSPVTPGPLAAWSASVLLWEFQLPALATAVTDSILDSGTAFDRRVASASPINPATVFRPFATAALRDAAITAPAEGNTAVVTGEDREYIYTGSAWVRGDNYTATGRTGCHVGRLGAVQTLTTATLTNITFETEVFDSDTFYPGGSSNTVTIPAGLGGTYQASVEVAWSGSPVVPGAALVVNGTANGLGGANTSAIAVLPNQLYTAFLELNAADTVGLQLIQSSGSNKDVICRLKLWRVGI